MACSKKVEYGTDVSGGTSPASDTPKENVDNRSIEIVDSEWTVAEGKALYSLTLHNASTEAECHFPTFTVTGKDESGKILFAEDQSFNFMRPGDTYTYASQIHKDVTPTTIEFATKNNEKNWTENEGTEHSDPYSFANLNEVNDTYQTVFTGEMKINKTWKDISTACGSVVFRDGNGKMIGGISSFIYSLGPEGSVMPIEVPNLGSPIPEHASFELYGIPWM